MFDAIVTAIIILFGQLVLLFFIYRWLKAKMRIAEAFVTPERSGQPSPLSLVMAKASDTITADLMAKVKGSAMNALSVDSRRAKAVQGAVVGDVLSLAAPPWLQALMSVMPDLKKKLIKNPDLVPYAMQMAGGLKGNNGEAAAIAAGPAMEDFGKL